MYLTQGNPMHKHSVSAGTLALSDGGIYMPPGGKVRGHGTRIDKWFGWAMRELVRLGYAFLGNIGSDFSPLCRQKWLR